MDSEATSLVDLYRAELRLSDGWLAKGRLGWCAPLHWRRALASRLVSATDSS